MDILTKSKSKSSRKYLQNSPVFHQMIKKSKSKSEVTEEVVPKKKKDSLYERIEKLKKDVISKNELKVKNQNLKEMQKLLMNRLEQQDEYFNQCMFGKQQEIILLTQRLKAVQNENFQLKESLQRSQNEVKKYKKFLKYYPQNMLESLNGNQSLQSKLEEHIKSKVSSEKSPVLNLKFPQLNNGPINNCGNTYLDLNLVVNNINSAVQESLAQEYETSSKFPLRKQSLHKFVIDEEMIEEDSERMDDNLRKKMREEAMKKLHNMGLSKFNPQKNLKTEFSKNYNVPDTDFKTPRTSKTQSDMIDGHSFQKAQSAVEVSDDEVTPCCRRGQNVIVFENQGQIRSSITTPTKMNHDFSEMSYSEKEETPSQVSKAPIKVWKDPTPKSTNLNRKGNHMNSIVHHERTNSNSPGKFILGIKPELALLLKKFNEIPLEELKKDIESFTNSQTSSPGKLPPSPMKSSDSY